MYESDWFRSCNITFAVINLKRKRSFFSRSIIISWNRTLPSTWKFLITFSYLSISKQETSTQLVSCACVTRDLVTFFLICTVNFLSLFLSYFVHFYCSYHASHSLRSLATMSNVRRTPQGKDRWLNVLTRHTDHDFISNRLDLREVKEIRSDSSEMQNMKATVSQKETQTSCGSTSESIDSVSTTTNSPKGKMITKQKCMILSVWLIMSFF